MKARDIMTRDVITVTQDTPVSDVARLLSERRISAAPVRGPEGAVVGLVSEFDLLARAGRTAGDVMTPDVICVSHETDVEELRALLIERQIKRVPVFAGQQLVGIVSRADVVRELILHWACEACGETSRAKEPPARCCRCGSADRFRHERQDPGM